MTSQQRQTITHINEDMATERWLAEQAAREVAELDAYSVLLAVEVKISEGRIEEAKAMVAAYRASKRSN